MLPSNPEVTKSLSFCENSIFFTHLEWPTRDRTFLLRLRVSHSAIVVSSEQVANILESRNLGEKHLHWWKFALKKHNYWTVEFCIKFDWSVVLERFVGEIVCMSQIWQGVLKEKLCQESHNLVRPCFWRGRQTCQILQHLVSKNFYLISRITFLVSLTYFYFLKDNLISLLLL